MSVIDLASEEKSSEKETSGKKGPNTITKFSHGSKEMAELLEKEQPNNMPRVGDLVTGTVASISKNGIVIDIKGRLTGLVRGKEIEDESGEYSKLAIGDTVETTILENENEQGMLELSLRQAGHRKAWSYLDGLISSGETVDAKIMDANKGGLMVKVGNVEGFLPVSQLTVEHYPRVEGGDKNRILDKLKSFIGESFKVKVITVKESEEKLIVSEKLAWEKEQNKLLAKHEIGDTVEGVITGVVDFGAFVEFGDGLEGLVHISELAWQRIENPKDIVKVGDEIKAKIIAIEDGRISLSVKRLSSDPWKDVGEKYSVGQIVEGKVIKLSQYGAFVELDKDIHGLAHASELGEASSVSPSDILKPGDSKKFKILSLEPAAHRLGLSLYNGESLESNDSKKEDPSPAESEKEKSDPKEEKKDS
jgi:small subunit ribosomal protein S1